MKPFRFFVVLFLVVGTAIPLSSSGQVAAPVGGGGVWSPEQVRGNCISDEQRAVAEREIRVFAAAHPAAFVEADVSPRYPFVPQAGNLWQDLFVNNFVDLDPTSGIRDWDCSAFTYDGHNGHDIDIRSFKEQEIGVPIFAALDGTVVSAHDGEPDMQTTSGNRPANYVILSHGNGLITWYWHMKQGSVAVTANQVVKAGTQLGLTGSSGNSTGPHLHFESQMSNVVFEPSAGTCRSGDSNWSVQRPIRRELHTRDFYFTDATTSNDPPFETVPRLGTFLTGTRAVSFRVFLGGVPAASRYRMRYLRPDGSVAIDSSGTLAHPFYRQAYHWWYWIVNLNVTGTWRVQYWLNEKLVADAPFRVVATSAENVNRAPNGIQVALDPPAPQTDEVVFCRVQTSLLFEDPDYDIVRYRYQWRRNGNIVREVTTAALSDAIPKDLAQTGDQLSCTVTPSDGQLEGTAAQATATYGSLLTVAVSGANYVRPEQALESIASAFGTNLATASGGASGSLPTTLLGTTVKVKDSLGLERAAPLFYVSPTQVNFQFPPGTADGFTTFTITSGDGQVSRGATWLMKTTPGLFAANAAGTGYPAADVVHVRADDSRREEPAARFDVAQGKYVPTPIDLGPETEQVYLILYGTGIRFRAALTDVAVTVGDVASTVEYAGAQGEYIGLDQINVKLPRTLQGRKEVPVKLIVEGKTANILTVHIK